MRARLDGGPALTVEQVLAVGIHVADPSEECLELVQGVGARDRGEDADGCTQADRLLAELVARLPLPRWDSLCVPGTADAYQPRSRVIRVGLAGRLGRGALWALPAVAHELGHQVGLWSPARAARPCCTTYRRCCGGLGRRTACS